MAVCDEQPSIEACEIISKTHRELHAQRQRHEIRTFFTALSLYAAVVAGFAMQKASVGNPCLALFYAVLLTIIGIVAVLYLEAMHLANAYNKVVSQFAENVLGEGIPGFATLRFEGVKFDSFVYQSIMICMFCLAAVGAILYAPIIENCSFAWAVYAVGSCVAALLLEWKIKCYRAAQREFREKVQKALCHEEEQKRAGQM